MIAALNRAIKTHNMWKDRSLAGGRQRSRRGRHRARHRGRRRQSATPGRVLTWRRGRLPGHADTCTRICSIRNMGSARASAFDRGPTSRCR